jgi:hypothetical protein
MEAIDIIGSKIVMLKDSKPPLAGDSCLVEHPTRGMVKVTAKASSSCGECCYWDVTIVGKCCVVMKKSWSCVGILLSEVIHD